jgi:hypothetical protein
MLVSIVLLVLLCEFVGMRKGRFKAPANPASQGVSYVSYVSYMRPASNSQSSSTTICAPQLTHKHMLAPHKHQARSLVVTHKHQARLCF